MLLVKVNVEGDPLTLRLQCRRHLISPQLKKYAYEQTKHMEIRKTNVFLTQTNCESVFRGPQKVTVKRLVWMYLVPVVVIWTYCTFYVLFRSRLNDKMAKKSGFSN